MTVLLLPLSLLVSLFGLTVWLVKGRLTHLRFAAIVVSSLTPVSLWATQEASPNRTISVLVASMLGIGIITVIALQSPQSV